MPRGVGAGRQERSEPPGALPARAAAPPPRGASPDRLAVDLAIKLGSLLLVVYFALRLLEPFLPLLLWSVVLAVALYPAYEWLAARLGGRRRLAAAVVTLLALAVVLGPATMLLSDLIRSLERLARQLAGGRPDLPPPPQTLVALPVLGPQLADAWGLASDNLEDFLARYGRPLIGAGEWTLHVVAHLAGSAVLVLAAVVIASFLYVPGPRLVEEARRIVGRVAGEHGMGFVTLAGTTIRGVARGVIGVAIVQALLVGVGLIAAGVPGAGLMTLAVLVFDILQIGAWPVILVALGWAWLHLETGTAVVLSLYLIPVAAVETVLKPLAMGKGLPTPMLVILVGVLGGTLAYGLIGLFVGPVVLAVVYDLLLFWTRGGRTRGRPRPRGTSA